ncbi:MAG: hypothetical protein U9Q80_02925 [Bacillota bacterium]|nr:hypothetical protein [Bacillota bacterium]
MLKITNTENLTGITITGTYEDINELYESIGRVVGSGLEIDNDSMPFIRILGVNYDLRHCFMGDREVTFVDNDYFSDLQKYHGKIHPETNVEFSVSIVWHEAMFAALALDDYIIIHEDDKRFKNKLAIPELHEMLIEEFHRNRYKDIAMVRLYQELIWEAFREATTDAAYKRLRKKSKEGQDVYYKSFNYTDFTTQFITILEMKYIHTEPEKRSKLLATHIGKIIKQSDDYQKVAREVREVAHEHGISPGDVQYANEEWPEYLEW